jgi:hypothetical protein
MDWEAAQWQKSQKEARWREKKGVAEHIASWKSAEKARVEKINSCRAQHKETLKVWEWNHGVAKQATQEFKDKSQSWNRLRNSGWSQDLSQWIS